MKSKLGLLAGLLAMGSIGDQAIFNTSYQGMGSPSTRRKSELTPNQKRIRLKSKRARIARRNNRS